MDELLTAVRILNVVLGLACVLLCVTKASAHWGRYNTTARAFTMSLTLFSLAAAWSAGEQLALEIPPGSRTPVMTLGLLALMYALWRTRGQSFYAEFKPDNVVPPAPPRRTTRRA